MQSTKPSANTLLERLQLASLLGRELKLIKPFVWMPRAIARRAFKEVIQPQVPLRLPCYDLVPVTDPTFDSFLPKRVGPLASGIADFRDLTGGVYKPRERIHRNFADLRLLATPTSRSRVADSYPN